MPCNKHEGPTGILCTTCAVLLGNMRTFLEYDDQQKQLQKGSDMTKWHSIQPLHGQSDTSAETSSQEHVADTTKDTICCHQKPVKTGIFPTRFAQRYSPKLKRASVPQDQLLGDVQSISIPVKTHACPAWTRTSCSVSTLFDQTSVQLAIASRRKLGKVSML